MLIIKPKVGKAALVWYLMDFPFCFDMQIDLGDSVGLVPDHATKQVIIFLLVEVLPSMCKQRGTRAAP